MHPFPGVGDPRGTGPHRDGDPTGEYLVNTSYLDYRDYRDNLKLVSGVALGRFTPLSVGADGRTARAWAELVSANYFDLLKVKPVLGRAFLPEEGRDGKAAPRLPSSAMACGGPGSAATRRCWAKPSA